MYNYKLQKLSPQQRIIVEKRQKSSIESSDSVSKRNTRKDYKVSLFLKFGNSPSNNYNARDTLDIYKNFCNTHKVVWISTDSLSRGMSEKKKNEFNDAINNGNRVSLYLIAGKSSNGNNQISYKSNVLEIISSKHRIGSPDKSLTPDEWKDSENLIWIKVGFVDNYTPKTTDDFCVLSTGNTLTDSIAHSQYNFGYIVEKKQRV